MSSTARYNTTVITAAVVFAFIFIIFFHVGVIPAFFIFGGAGAYGVLYPLAAEDREKARQHGIR